MTTGRQALDYAERQLGVHQVYEEAQVRAARLHELREQLATMKSEKARAEQEYLDAEYDFVTTARADLQEMSQTAFDRHIKIAVHNHPKLRPLRADLAQRSTNLDLLEASIARARVDVEIAIARMSELGGYFAYLAAIKNAETVKQSGDNWPSSTA